MTRKHPHPYSPERTHNKYAGAIKHLHQTDDTIAEAAELFNVSYTGLRDHALTYHKFLVRKRMERRRNAIGEKRYGKLMGNGKKHLPSDEHAAKYNTAIQLYRTTAMTLKEIADETGVTLNGLRSYIHIWHVDLILDRRGVVYSHSDDKEKLLANSKQYRKSASFKYEEAIKFLKSSGRPTAEVAKKFNLHPDCFREYLYEHEPELASQMGMTNLPNGKRGLARSAQKYKEAIQIYQTSTETLKSISERLNIPYKSLSGYIRRNHPDVIEIHNKLVKRNE